jgi:hypothetical protein
MAPRTVPDVQRALRTQLGVNELAFGSICARVVLRTGVNLRTPRPDHEADPVAVGKVVSALADMGYRL